MARAAIHPGEIPAGELREPGRDAAFNALFAATVSFVGGHFLLSSAAVRPRLVARLGAPGFRAAYSVVALAAFVWMAKACSTARPARRRAAS